jgi:hypothetical protein
MPMEMTGNTVQETSVLPAEIIGTVRLDWRGPLEIISIVRSDRLQPMEVVQLARQDYPESLEWVGNTVLETAVLPMERVSSLQRDATSPLIAMSQLTLDRLQPMETGSALQLVESSPTPMEFGSGLLQDHSLAWEEMWSVRLDFVVGLNFTGNAVFGDTSIAMEWRLGVSELSPSPMDAISQMVTDGALPYEHLGSTILGNSTLPAETLTASAVGLSSRQPLEMLGGPAGYIAGPLEWAAGIPSTLSVASLEILSNTVLEDSAQPLEMLSNTVLRDQPMPLEGLVQPYSGQPTPAEVVGTVQQTYPVSLETTAGTATETSSSPLEMLSNTVQEQLSLPTEKLGSAGVSLPAPAEVISTLTLTWTGPLEMLASGVVLNTTLPMEALKLTTLEDSPSPAELLATSGEGAGLPAETVGAVSEVSVSVAEFLASAATTSPLPMEQGSINVSAPTGQALEALTSVPGYVAGWLESSSQERQDSQHSIESVSSEQGTSSLPAEALASSGVSALAPSEMLSLGTGAMVGALEWATSLRQDAALVLEGLASSGLTSNLSAEWLLTAQGQQSSLSLEYLSIETLTWTQPLETLGATVVETQAAPLEHLGNTVVLDEPMWLAGSAPLVADTSLAFEHRSTPVFVVGTTFTMHADRRIVETEE